MKTLLLYIVIFLNFLLFSRAYCNDTITGNPYINNFSTESFQLQNWAIAEDNRGVTYFGNGSGVLEFDGTSWKAIKTSNNSTVRSLDIDSLGTIYVGASGDFGYLAIDPEGTLHYRSLTNLLPDSLNNIKRILKTFCTKNGVYFISENAIFRFFNNTIETINVDLEEQQRYGFNIDDNIFLIQKNKGFFYLNKNEVIELPHSDMFAKDYGRYVILPYINNQLLIATENKGMFIYNLDMISLQGKIFPGNTNNNTSSVITKKFHTRISDYLAKNGLYSACKIDDNNYAFGTISGGIIIMNDDGQFVRIINTEKGLRGNSILDLYLDKRNNLWAALQDGLAYIELSSPINYFNELNGLEGIILSTIQHNNTRYIGTHLGIFELDKYSFQNENDNYSFHLIGNKETTCLTIYKFNNHLIASTNEGVVLIEDSNSRELIKSKSPYCFLQSPKHENILFMGSSSGLDYAVFNNTMTVQNVFKYPEISNSIIEMTSDKNNNLWLTTQFNGIISVEFENILENDYKLHYYDTAHGLPSLNQNYVFSLGDGIKVTTQKGIYKTTQCNDYTTIQFVQDTQMYNGFNQQNCSASKIILSDNSNYILSEEIGIGTFESNKTSFDIRPFKKISPELIYTLFFEDNLLWICTTDGLFKYSPDIKKDYDKKYSTLIRKVIVGKDSVLFNGTFYHPENMIFNDYVSSWSEQPSIFYNELKYKSNNIQFDFAAPFFESSQDVMFKYKLEGFDEEWSNWSLKTEKSYTNLFEGEYTFKVKAKNIFDVESEVADFRFLISPPIYRTIVAYIGYILFLISLFYLGFRLYARRLVAQNIKLEKTVKERTVEIRKQRDQISEQKQSITDSIHYASRIQGALLPPEELMNKHLSEYFVLFKPRDIVSGDFYWFAEHSGRIYITAADSTGHGVPGAFMSMLGMSFLNEIVSQTKDISAHMVLNELRAYVKKSLRQTGKKNEAKDGMDMALCIIDKNNMELEYAGANNPLYIIRNKELTQYRADRMPIGIYIKDDRSFTGNKIPLQNDDTLYIFSDGYVDQFGGHKNKKFMNKNFKSLLIDNHEKPMSYQKEILDQTIESWKGENDQVDDILVIGIKIT